MNKLLHSAVLLSLILSPGTICGAGEQEPAVSPPDSLLDRVGNSVERFWSQVESFACTESVLQEKINRKGNSEFRKQTVFDYLALARPGEDTFSVEEIRIPKKNIPDKSMQPSLLATNGFPTLLLVFHPQYQSHYKFQLVPATREENNLAGIRFEHIPGTSSTCALRLQDRIYPLELKGTAWVEPASGNIRKITAALKAPLKEINMAALDVEVIYSSQPFPSGPDLVWLPATAVISFRTALQHWRNTHQYSRYKRFTVESQETRSR